MVGLSYICLFLFCLRMGSSTYVVLFCYDGGFVFSGPGL